MKVLMLSDFPVDTSRIEGGVQSAAYNLTTALARHTDAEVTVVSFSRDVAVSQPSLSDDGIRVIRAPQQTRFNTATGYRHERRVLEQILRQEQPELVHAQSEGFYATLAVHSGLPNVYTVHGVALKEIELQRRAVGRLKSRIRARSVRAHHRRAKHIIAINDYTKTEIAPLHRAQVWQIPNAVDERFFGLPDGETAVGRVLMVGGVSPRKDTRTALRAVRRLTAEIPNLHLDIVGPVSSDYAAGLRPLLEEPELAGRVSVHGLIERDQLLALYSAADIFLLTSVEESSPIAIVEAMAAGKPIVATSAGGVSEMVDNGMNGYVCEIGDDEEIAAALTRTLLDRSLRDRLGAASRERAAARWSARAVALATYDAYKEILDEG